MGGGCLKHILKYLYCTKYKKKLTYALKIHQNVFPIKNDTKSTQILSTSSQKVFLYISSYGGKFLKHILTYLYCTKCNEINMSFLYTKVSFL